MRSTGVGGRLARTTGWEGGLGRGGGMSKGLEGWRRPISSGVCCDKWRVVVKY